MGPDIEYNSTHSRLAEVLQSIDRTGNYCCSGRIEAPPPRMHVSSVGQVAFPVLDAQIRQLIDAAERAPYGRGTETIVDTSVRDCWQISADDVELGGARWPETVASIIDAAADGLGIPPTRIGVQLYKLLVYEKGGFFKEHRDTEKAKRMVGTLVISLPTDGEGGQVVIRHQDREEAVDLSIRDPGELAFAAFFADCAHWTEPVRSGHRVSLVYNLVMLPGSRDVPRTAPDFSSHAMRAARILSEWASGDRKPKKVVWILDHLYSESGLDFEVLKGRDALLCRVLAEAARIADCAYYLALLLIEESGAPDDDYGYGGWYGGDIDAESVDIEEVHDGTYRLTGLVGPAGESQQVPGGLPLLDGEALPDGALDNTPPESQRLLEATGNEGATVERSYRVASLVLWPRASFSSVVADGPLDNLIDFAIPALFRDRKAGLDLVDKVVGTWLHVVDPRRGWSLMSKTTAESLPKTLDLLVRADDEARCVRFLGGVMPFMFRAEFTNEILGLMERVAAPDLGTFLAKLVKEELGHHPGRVFAFFARASARSGSPDPDAWRRVVREHLASAFRQFPSMWAADRKSAYRPWPTKPDKQVPSAVRNAILAGRRLDLHFEGEDAARHILAQRTRSNTARVLPPVLKDVWTLDPTLMSASTLAELWQKAAELLLNRSTSPPGNRMPRTFPGPALCQCEHCRKLADFCRNPKAHVVQFRMRKDLRSHVELQIQRERLPIRCTTEKTGIPHTLVCTKNSADYIRRVNRYEKDIESMRILLPMAPPVRFSWAGGVEGRLRQAIARSG